MKVGESNMVKLRRTMMFIPGNNPSMVSEGHIYGSDSIMFDLEDSVSLREKDAARRLVFNALQSVDYGDVEKVVRVNGLDTIYGALDIEYMVKAGIDVIRLPKTDTADDVVQVDNLVSKIESELGITNRQTKLMAAIESPLGIINAYQIATASDRLIGIALGAEDFVKNMKTERYPDGKELFLARSNILMAARAAGIYAIDTVYSNIENSDGLRVETELIKQLGFDGKSVIHPKQIAIIHSVYEPSAEDIEYAVRVLHGIREAEEKGSGVISVDGKMIDAPVVDRAYRVLEMAKAMSIPNLPNF